MKESVEKFSPITSRSPEQPLALISDHGSHKIKTVQCFINDVWALSECLPEGRNAINFCADRYRFLVTFFAICIKGKCNYLPPNRSIETQKLLLEEDSNLYLIYDSEDYSGPVESFKYPDSLKLTGEPRDIPKLPHDHLCALCFSSGSTGKPSSTKKEWGTLLVGAKINAQHMLGDLRSVHNVVATVPAQHLWGLETSIMLPLIAPLCVSNQMPFFPKDINDALAKLDSPRILISTPTHLSAMIKSGLPKTETALVLCATAPLDLHLAESVEQELGCQLLEVYGCTEAGSIARRRTTKEQQWTPFEGFAFSSEDEYTTVRADHIHDTPELQDNLEFDDNRQFKLSGRRGDLINVGGKRGSISQINQLIQRVDGVLDSVVFLPTDSAKRHDRPCAIIVKSDDQLSRHAIQTALRQALDPVFIPRPMLFTDKLPRNETGKLTRVSLDTLYQTLMSK